MDVSLNTSDAPKIYEDLIENKGVRITLLVFYFIAIILAAVGNAFLIIPILWYRKHVKDVPKVYLVFNLALCDFINVTVHHPMRLVDLLVVNDTYEETVVLCKVASFFSSYFGAVAIMTIVALSQERLLKICFPMKAERIVTVGNVRRLLVIIWAVAFVTVLPLPIMFSGVTTIRLSLGVTSFCLMDLNTDESGTGYYIFLFIMYYAIPVLVITISYAKIFVKLHKKLPDMIAQGTAVSRRIERQRSFARRTLAIAIIFTVTLGPHFCTFLLIMTGYVIEKNPIFTLMIIEFLPIISQVANPFVYALQTRSTGRGGGVSIGLRNPFQVLKSMDSTYESDKSRSSIVNSFRKLLKSDSGSSSRPSSDIANSFRSNSSREKASKRESEMLNQSSDINSSFRSANSGQKLLKSNSDRSSELFVAIRTSDSQHKPLDYKEQNRHSEV